MKTILKISVLLGLWFSGVSAFAVESPAEANQAEADKNPVFSAYTGKPKAAAGNVLNEASDPAPDCCGKNLPEVDINGSTNPTAGATGTKTKTEDGAD
jgi:hypothetical protein